MKASVLILLAIGYFIHFNSCAQSFSILRGMDKAIANKAAFNNAVNRVEENENRFFYKKSQTGYIFKGTDSNLDADNKSYTDIQLSKNRDTIIAKTYTYQMSSASFVLSSTVHGDGKNKRMIYKRIKEDVYVDIDDLGKKRQDIYNAIGELGIITDTVPLVTYLLYNATDGLYFHRFFYKKERIQYTASYVSRFEYISGEGMYRKSKKYKLNAQDMEASKNTDRFFGVKLIDAYKDTLK